MPVNGVLEIDGLDHNTADAGIPINSLPIVSGFGGVVTDFSIIWGGDGLPPNDGAISIQGFPYAGAGAIATGTDSNGSIGVAKTFTINNDAGTLWSTTAGDVTLADGFWAQDVRVFISDITGTRRIRIDILSLEIPDFTPDLNDTGENLSYSDESWDPVEELGSVDLTWDYTDLGENPDGFIITRDGDVVGTKPIGANPQTFTDQPRTSGVHTYCVRAYTYNPPRISACSNTVSPDFGGGDSPDINITSDMELAFEWNSIMAFITDPSGIYAMIPGKTHDTLYNRAVETSVDVKIPNPIVITAFVPEE